MTKRTNERKISELKAIDKKCKLRNYERQKGANDKADKRQKDRMTINCWFLFKFFLENSNLSKMFTHNKNLLMGFKCSYKGWKNSLSANEWKSVSNDFYAHLLEECVWFHCKNDL